jgi:hypothetical protein
MTLLNDQLVSLNDSIAALPSMYGLAARFAVLNASLAEWRTIDDLLYGPLPAFYIGMYGAHVATALLGQHSTHEYDIL